MFTNPPAKILLVFALFFSVLTGCGGDSDESSTEESPSTSEEGTEETAATSSEPEEQVVKEPADADREMLLILIRSFLPGEEVPETFIECWIDQTLELTGLTPEELKDMFLEGDSDQELDAVMGEVVFTCIGELSPEEFAAVLESGILDEDNESPEPSRENPEDYRDQTFPDETAPDLISSPGLADPGVQIVVSPGIVDGSLWSGTISGSGLPPGLPTAIFPCGGTLETVLANFFESCDIFNPIIALIDDQGDFTVTVNDPQPTDPRGSCIVVTTDPDDNPDTDDGPGAIVCSAGDQGQTYPEFLEEDLLSADAFADPGIQITVSPGIVDGSLWEGTISGSGFTPGETVGIIGCAGTYETIFETFLFSCDFDGAGALGVVDETGEFASAQIGPFPTVAEGTCLLIGTDPDGNFDTDDGEGAIVCTK